MPVEEQVVSLYAGTRGFLDTIPVNSVNAYEKQMLEALRTSGKSILEAIRTKKALDDNIEKDLNEFLGTFTSRFGGEVKQAA